MFNNYLLDKTFIQNGLNGPEHLDKLVEIPEVAELVAFINSNFVDHAGCQVGTYFMYDGFCFLNDAGTIVENLLDHVERITPEYLDLIKRIFLLTAEAGLPSIGYVLMDRSRDFTNPKCLLAISAMVSQLYVSNVENGIEDGKSPGKYGPVDRRNHKLHLYPRSEEYSTRLAAACADILSLIDCENNPAILKSFTSTLGRLCSLPIRRGDIMELMDKFLNDPRIEKLQPIVES